MAGDAWHMDGMVDWVVIVEGGHSDGLVDWVVIAEGGGGDGWNMVE